MILLLEMGYKTTVEAFLDSKFLFSLILLV